MRTLKRPGPQRHFIPVFPSVPFQRPCHRLTLYASAGGRQGNCMTSRVLLALMVAISIAGCARVSESRLNPFNWFGRSESAEVVQQAPNADPRNLVTQVISLRVEQVPAGAIIHATGLPPRQGYFNGDLVPVGGETPQNGILVYEFRSASPYTNTRVGPQQSREVIVGRFVSEQTLATVRQIRVNGATNALVVRR